MALRPIRDRILVRPDDAPTMVGRLHLPADAAERPVEALVLAVGPDVESWLAPGDRVLYAAYAGEEIEAGLVLQPADVLLVATAST